MKNILKWFRLNSLKANPGKFQFMILGDKSLYKHIIKINLTCFQSSDYVGKPCIMKLEKFIIGL